MENHSGVQDASFDVGLSECSFCTFPDKVVAAAELARILRPSGRLGVADVTLESELTVALQGLAGWVCCLGGALPRESYREVLQPEGFVDFLFEDHSELVREVRRNAPTGIRGRYPGGAATA